MRQHRSELPIGHPYVVLMGHAVAVADTDDDVVEADGVDDERYRRRAVEAGALWSAAALLQIDRVVDVGRVLVEQHRERPWDKPDWDEQAYRIPSNRLGADRHFLLVAAFNLVRAVDFLRYPAHVDTSRLDGIRRLSVAVKTLRDCNEHWNEEVRDWVRKPSNLTGKALGELAQFGPDADIRSHQLTASGQTTVAGVLRLDDLQTAALEAEAFYSDLSSSWYVWNGWPDRSTG